MTRTDFELVASFPSLGMAEVAAEELRSSGLSVRIERGETGGIVPPLGASVGLLVPAADAERARAVLSVVASPSTSAAPGETAPSVSGRRPLATVAIAVLTLVAGGLGLKLQQARSELDIAYEGGPLTPPVLKDNCILYYWKGTSILGHSLCDVDRDGRHEFTQQFNLQGALLSESSDADDDGAAEVIASFDSRGRLVARQVDSNEDGVQELLIIFDRYGVESARAYDDDQDGRIDRWVEKDDEGTTTTWTDNFGDGTPDELSMTNSAGVVVQRMKASTSGWIAR